MRPSNAAPPAGAAGPQSGRPEDRPGHLPSDPGAAEAGTPASDDGRGADQDLSAPGAPTTVGPHARPEDATAAAGEEAGQETSTDQPTPVAHRPPEPVLTVLLYSDDIRTRQAVKLAVGRRPAPGLPRVVWRECATPPAVIATMDAGGIDVVVLDGEAAPAGGMGLCRQLKSEIYRCPPVLVLTGRPQDAWLAAWSLADLAVPHPLDPMEVASAVAELARRRLAA